MAKRLEWEKANRREAMRPQRQQREVVVWWWTPSRGGYCHECGEAMPKGSRIAYSHIDLEALCEICADSRGLQPKPSKAWEHKVGRGRKARRG